MSGAILVTLVSVVTGGGRRGVIRRPGAEQRPRELLVWTEKTNLSNESKMPFVTS